mmetsp:Transcript_10391/g.31298  ORF Transcript_10391/g.31298 Transcript_10391/m.31298 type:complete len:206 (-) Transcript_10391:455-1072(-)
MAPPPPPPAQQEPPSRTPPPPRQSERRGSRAPRPWLPPRAPSLLARPPRARPRVPPPLQAQTPLGPLRVLSRVPRPVRAPPLQCLQLPALPLALAPSAADPARGAGPCAPRGRRRSARPPGLPRPAPPLRPHQRILPRAPPPAAPAPLLAPSPGLSGEALQLAVRELREASTVLARPPLLAALPLPLASSLPWRQHRSWGPRRGP